MDSEKCDLNGFNCYKFNKLYKKYFMLMTMQKSKKLIIGRKELWEKPMEKWLKLMDLSKIGYKTLVLDKNKNMRHLYNYRILMISSQVIKWLEKMNYKSFKEWA